MPKDNEQHRFLPYGKQVIDDADIQAVVKTLKSDYLTTGPKIAEFEKHLSNAIGAKQAVVVNNGTTALHLACIAADIQKGDYAIVPSLTFLATANAVRYCDADVLFCDVDPKTALLDTDHLQSVLDDNADKNIKAVLPVHLAGQIADLPKIKQITQDKGIKIIADSCHALGSEVGDYQAGSATIEDMATFSFHPVKTIAMGEGGAITTSDSAIAQKMRLLRSHAMEQCPDQGMWFHKMQQLGFNYRATDMQCALGISQLSKLENFIAKRRRLARFYDTLLAPYAPKILPPHRVENQEPAWHLYAMRLDFDQLGFSRNELMHALKKRNIGTQVHYIPVHSQPYYQNLYGDIKLPGADTYYQNTLSFPLYPTMEEEDVTYVVDNLIDICNL